MLDAALNINSSNEEVNRSLATILSTAINPLSRIDDKKFPGLPKLRVQSLALVRRLQDLVSSWNQSTRYDASHYQPIVKLWMKHLNYAVDHQGLIFFSQDAELQTEREALAQEIRTLLELLERDGHVSDPELGATFRKVRDWFQ